MTDSLLLHGDCFERMKEIPANSVALVLCDLPYGLTDADWDNALDLNALWEEYKRIVVPCGTIVLFAQQPFTTDLINSRRPWFKYCWCWVKNTRVGGLYCHSQPMRQTEDVVVFQKVPDRVDPATVPEWAEIRRYLLDEYQRLGLTRKCSDEILGSQMTGHYLNSSQWQPPSLEAYTKLQQATGGFQRSWEELRRLYEKGGAGSAVAGKQRFVRYHPPGVREYIGGEVHLPTTSDLYKNVNVQGGYRYKTVGHPTNVLRFDTPTGRLHPTQKPVPLLRYLICTYTDEGETVLDNCMGSGSTVIAAIDTGRRYIGIEKDERYFKAAKERVAERLNADVQLSFGEDCGCAKGVEMCA